MQATRRFNACLDEHEVPHLNLEADAKSSPCSDSAQTGKVQTGKALDELTQQPTPPSSPPPDLQDEQSEKRDSAEAEVHDGQAGDNKESATKKMLVSIQ